MFPIASINAATAAQRCNFLDSEPKLLAWRSLKDATECSEASTPLQSPDSASDDCWTYFFGESKG